MNDEMALRRAATRLDQAKANLRDYEAMLTRFKASGLDVPSGEKTLQHLRDALAVFEKHYNHLLSGMFSSGPRPNGQPGRAKN